MEVGTLLRFARRDFTTENTEFTERKHGVGFRTPSYKYPRGAADLWADDFVAGQSHAAFRFA